MDDDLKNLRDLMEEVGELRADGMFTFGGRKPKRAMYYHRDGEPIFDTDLLPDFMQWAMLFEQTDRHVAVTRTLYGERLSTVYLGMEHGFVNGKALIFETMLFAPEDEQGPRLRLTRTDLTREEREAYEERERYIQKHYPHHQVLQLRYTSEGEAADRHETLRMQCLIPPRWRHFLLWTIGRDSAWSFYDDEDDEDKWT
jgi:hypothetical protein